MIDGDVHPHFWPVARALERQLRGGRGGAAVCVYHRGQKVVDIWGGTKDRGTPWQADTLALSFSTTKGVAATALHVLVDRGVLDYDDPVATCWPEFAQNGKAGITVRHILCHEAGLYSIRNLIDHAERMYDWEYMVDALARATPAHEPGAANAYHGLTYGWLVGEIIRRTSGRTITAIVRDEIAAPLALDGLHIGAPAEVHHRVARLDLSDRPPRPPEALRAVARIAQRVFNVLRLPVDLYRLADALIPRGAETLDWSSPRMWSAVIPAANGLFTARSLAQMYAALAAGGAFDGVRLLSERTVARATEVQNRRLDRVVPFPMHWRLGYHRAATTRGTPRRGFAHYGFGGSGAWADPDRQLAVAMVLNSGIGTPFGDLRTARIGGVALRCASRR
jgi:CubicO group peptidase (beta-lactamase class C family)